MNIFSYESKLMQTLMVIGDYIILNLLFVLFCLPIFTIGAAQAGLYSGMKVVMDKEDDSSPAAAFWKGFRNGFGSITIVWCFYLAILAFIFWLLSTTLLLDAAGMDAPVGFAIAALAIVMLFQSLSTVFHSRFGCKPWQLVRNTWMLLIGFPLRCLGVAILSWLPIAILLLDTFLFMQAAPLFMVGYYSVAFMINLVLMKKPFNLVLEAYNEQMNPPVVEEVQEEAQEAEEESVTVE